MLFGQPSPSRTWDQIGDETPDQNIGEDETPDWTLSLDETIVETPNETLSLDEIVDETQGEKLDWIPHCTKMLFYIWRTP